MDIGEGVFIDPDVPGLAMAPGDGEAQLPVDPIVVSDILLLAPELGEGHGEAEVADVVDPDVV